MPSLPHNCRIHAANQSCVCYILGLGIMLMISIPIQDESNSHFLARVISPSLKSTLQIHPRSFSALVLLKQSKELSFLQLLLILLQLRKQLISLRLSSFLRLLCRSCLPSHLGTLHLLLLSTFKD